MKRSVAHVLGRGRIDLKMTSRKVLTLSDVQHVPDIRKNLISGSLLIQSGFKIVLESNRLVISKGNLFVGKVLYQAVCLNLMCVNLLIYLLLKFLMFPFLHQLS